MWEHGPKLVRKAVLNLFLEVMLCFKQLAAGLWLGGTDALLGGTRKLN